MITLTLCVGAIVYDMACHFPLTAWRSADLDDISATGKHKLVFRADLGFPNTKMEIPCGQCTGCRLDRARAWAIRCMHEASLHSENCFLTLTYDDEHLPESGSLNKRDIQLFLKRLRDRIAPKRVRFLQCGEYGDEFSRPHHHVLLFGHDFSDKLLFRGGKKNKLYTSALLKTLWPLGHHTIGAVDYDACSYCARYVLKKVTGDAAIEHYDGKLKEYITMSRRPGIAADWFRKFKADIFNHDKCVVEPGFIARPPKYYDKLYELHNPDHFKEIKIKRRAHAKENPLTPADRTRLHEFSQEMAKKEPDRSFESGG
nr:MAG: replication initiator protein [Microvirus sp.]